MEMFDRITMNPKVMGGKACIRGMRITVGTIVGFMSTGAAIKDVLELYPFLEEDDVKQALAYAAWRASEREVELADHR